MLRPMLTFLFLSALLAGCGDEQPELRSRACDEGQPVVATGQITLDEAVPEEQVTAVRVTLSLVSAASGVQQKVTALARARPGSFPLAFTLCGDVSARAPEDRLSTTVQVEHGMLGNYYATQEHAFTGAAVTGLQLHVRKGYPLEAPPLLPCDGPGC